MIATEKVQYSVLRSDLSISLGAQAVPYSNLMSDSQVEASILGIFHQGQLILAHALNDPLPL
jgi:hypothetical protein